MARLIDVPADIREFGERHGIPNFAEATYRNGYEQCARDLSIDAAEIFQAMNTMEEALRHCQSVLAMLISPKPGESITNAWAQCVEAEAKARAAIALVERGVESCLTSNALSARCAKTLQVSTPKSRLS